MKKYRFILIYFLAVSILLAGCGSTKPEMVAQIATSVAATVAAAPTATPLPTLTPYPTATSLPTLTPYPTATSLPTLTPYPTYTPSSFTPTPPAMGEWLEGHFWSIRIIDVQVTTDLNGTHPDEEMFILVSIQWKANNLAENHIMDGIDFELVDAATGERYGIVGMFFESYESHYNIEFHEGKWLTIQARGDAEDYYMLVFDVPDATSISGFKLWFQDFPLIGVLGG